MSSQLQDLGFSVQDEQGVSALLLEAADAGASIPSRHGAYICWAPGEGVELWLQVGRNREILGFSPHFRGVSGICVQVAEVLTSSPFAMTGRLYAWAGPMSGQKCFAGPALVIDVPDLDLIRDSLRVPMAVTVQVAAFAHAAECFATEEAFNRKQEGKAYRMSHEYFIPNGTFAQPARAEAAFAGQIESSVVRINPATGLPFHHLQVQTRIGAVDVVADPANLEGRPLPGGIIQGYFWLSGRVLEQA